MTTKLLFLFAVIVGTHCNVSLQAQELPDTVWRKNINSGALKFSPDGRYIYTTISYNILKIETSTGETLDTFAINRPLMKNLSVSPTGDTIVVSGNNYTMFWDVNTGDTLFTLKYGEEAEITPDGKRLLTTNGHTGFDTPQILVTNIETKQIIKSFTGRYYYAGNLQISPDGKYFSFNDFRGTYTTVILIDLNTYEEIKIFEDPNKNSFYNAGYSPNAEILVIANNNNMFFYDLKKLELIKTLKYYEEENVSDRGLGKPVFTNDSKYLIYGYFDYEDFDPNKIIVWNLEGDSLEYEYLWPADKSIDISKDDYLVACGQILGDLSKLYLLRPNWKSTDIQEQKNDDFKYTLKDGKLKIFFDKELLEKPEINIYNILGVGAHCNVPVQNGNEIEIDLEYLTSGVYFVVVDFAGKWSVIKILKD